MLPFIGLVYVLYPTNAFSQKVIRAEKWDIVQPYNKTWYCLSRITRPQIDYRSATRKHRGYLRCYQNLQLLNSLHFKYEYIELFRALGSINNQRSANWLLNLARCDVFIWFCYSLFVCRMWISYPLYAMCMCGLFKCYLFPAPENIHLIT